MVKLELLVLLYESVTVKPLVRVAVVPSLRTIWKSPVWIDERRMNQSNVTGMLSRPLAPDGQPTALSVPHEALRTFGLARGLTSVAIVVAAALAVPAAEACTRIVYQGASNDHFIGRSMDWEADTGTDLWAFPEGMTRDGGIGNATGAGGNGGDLTLNKITLGAAVRVDDTEAATGFGGNIN